MYEQQKVEADQRISTTDCVKEDKEMNENMFYLGLAGDYAKQMTGCTKVAVGCCIVKHTTVPAAVVALGANRAVPDLCKYRGCLRVEKYGSNSKMYRSPEDCRAIHSEIDAISKAASAGVSTAGATMYITRYPCEACARAIIAAGIKRVVYGRNQLISDTTRQMFESAGVEYINCKEYQEDDTTA